MSRNDDLRAKTIHRPTPTAQQACFSSVNYYASLNNATPQSSLVNIIDSMEHISEDLKSRAAVKLSHGEVLYTCTAQMLS